MAEVLTAVGVVLVVLGVAAGIRSRVRPHGRVRRGVDAAGGAAVALLGALAPLGILPFVVLWAGVAGLVPGWVEMAGAAAGAVIAYVFIRRVTAFGPEQRALFRRIREGLTGPRKKPLGVVWFLVLALVVSALAVTPRPSSVIVGFAGFALLAWVLATALRVLGIATDGLRTGLAVGVGIAITAGLSRIGALPLGNAVDETPWWAFILVCAVPAVIAGTVKWRWRATHDTPSLAPGFAWLGLVSAGVAAVLMGVALTGVAVSGDVEAVEGGARVTLPNASQLDARQLAAAYSPVLSFTSGERWPAIDARDYYDDADVRARIPGRNVPAADWAPMAPKPGLAALSTCRGAPVPCYVITADDCDDGDDPCAKPRRAGDRPPEDPGVVYARVAARGDSIEMADGSPNPFIDPAPRFPRLDMLIQYWLFYRFDEWRSTTPFGSLVQRHEGDWEAVTLGLEDGVPVFVAYSAHCGGEWVPWADAEVTGGTHPLVAVAEGSHANYARRATSQAPDWAGCADVPFPGDAVNAFSVASNLRDVTGADWRQTPAVVMTSAAAAPMSAKAVWGPDDVIALKRVWDSPETVSDGPASPPLQPLWQRPLRTIFFDHRWRGPKASTPG